MTETKSRTLYYRRAVWHGDPQENLQELLSAAHLDLDTCALRTFEYGDKEMQGLAFVLDNTGILFHVATYVPNQSTSIVPIPSNNSSQDTTPNDPPQEHNYMVGDIFFLVSENHVVLCPSGARESVAGSYIKCVLDRNGPPNICDRFTIEKIADMSKIRLLHEEGIKKIDLGASIYEATMDYDEQTNPSGRQMVRSAIDHVLALLTHDDDPTLRNLSNEARESLTVKLEISNDSRRRGADIGRRVLEKIGTMLIEDQEEFKIETQTGKIVTATEIRLNTSQILLTKGNSVSRDQAWPALRAYLYKLRETGLLEQ